MDRLISLAEHSDYLENNFKNDILKWKLHRNRVIFGRQSVELWMFFPCTLIKGVWTILKEPISYDGMDSHDSVKLQEYQDAKEKCLFTGFEYVAKWFNTHLIAYDAISGIGQFPMSNYLIVEDMVGEKVLELTPNTKKLFGL